MCVLTAVYYLPEEILPPEEVPRGAVPPSVPELVLALVDGLVGTLDDCHDDTRVLSDQPPLFPPQRRLGRGVHIDHGRRHRHQVVRLP